MSAQTTNRACFENIITLEGCCDNIVLSSGLTCDKIDITKDFINEIITRSFVDAKDFHNKKLDFAITSVISECLTFLNPVFRASTLIDNFRLGYFQDNLKMITGDGSLKGINIDLCNVDSYLQLFISEISLQLNKTGDVDILIYDLIEGELLETITIACAPNKVSKVFPQKIFYSPKRKLNLFIGYDSTGIDSNTTFLKRDCRNNCQSLNNPYEIVTACKIAESDDKIKSNLITIADTGGLSVVHSISCDHRAWLCSFSNLLALPILYRYGQLVMEFALNVSPNERTNTTENLNVEELRQRHSMYSSQYADSLKNALENIKTPQDRKCFVCKEPVKHVSAF